MNELDKVGYLYVIHIVIYIIVVLFNSVFYCTYSIPINIVFLYYYYIKICNKHQPILL